MDNRTNPETWVMQEHPGRATQAGKDQSVIRGKSEPRASHVAGIMWSADAEDIVMVHHAARNGLTEFKFNLPTCLLKLKL